MQNFDYKCGRYDVADTFTIHSDVAYFGIDDDKGWFRLPAGKIKGDSTCVRLIEQRAGLVVHKSVIDWDSTFFFLKHDIYQMIENKFKNQTSA